MHISVLWLITILFWCIGAYFSSGTYRKATERLRIWTIIGVIESVVEILNFPLLLITAFLLTIILVLYEINQISPTNKTSLSGLIIATPVYIGTIFYTPYLAALYFILYIAFLSQTKLSEKWVRFLTPLMFLQIAIFPIVLLLQIASYKTIICLLMLVHTTDISAGFLGKAFPYGTPFPILSPNKTFSGLIGSLICTLIMSIILNNAYLLMPISDALILGGIIWQLAVIGDLIGSKIKRIYGLKDYSNLLGPHGGVIDRIDSLTLVAMSLPLIYEVIG